ANPHAYVVAVERSLLPEGPFHVQLDADDPPWGAPEERTHVDVDLRAPGSEATDAQIHHAPSIEEAEPEPEPAIEDGHEGEVPNGARYVWFERAGCERPVVGPFDGVLWRLADGEPAWEVLDGQETWLHPASEAVMVVTTGEMDYLFVPAGTASCD
ncbi:MAG: hypothetical protein GX593_02785, partial [Actinomycetales bacterium]|nr:hypothetical protein [Actinomycetales bacterium]